MQAQIVIPKANGEKITYPLRVHNSHGQEGVKIAMETTEEDFSPWVFYLLREVGAHIVTDTPEVMRKALGLAESETGVVAKQ